MNNKRIGAEFEKKVCAILKARGHWVHFLSPDSRGAQPFDIIAVKDNYAIAVECKTLADSRRYFSIDRLEENQIQAFDYWMRKGNGSPVVVIGYRGEAYMVFYDDLKRLKRIDMHKWELML